MSKQVFFVDSEYAAEPEVAKEDEEAFSNFMVWCNSCGLINSQAAKEAGTGLLNPVSSHACFATITCLSWAMLLPMPN